MSDALAVIKSALQGRKAWLVGGAMRDRLLGRPTDDLDVVVESDPKQAARAIAQVSSGAACFSLSEDFDTWRVIDRSGAWQIDVQGMRGNSILEDLKLRDFTINSIAESLDGGERIDPFGGVEDLAARSLCSTTENSFSDDPLRVLRLVRLAVELNLKPHPQTLTQAQTHSQELAGVSPERVFAELKRIISSEDPISGLQLMEQVDVMEVVLPELGRLHAVDQSDFHHLDVYDHTIEVLAGVVALERDPGSILHARYSEQIAELLGEPLADGLTRAGALRWGALLHDVAKPLTRAVSADGRVSFLGHDIQGASLSRTIFKRLRTSRELGEHVAALVQTHLRLGFLTHAPQPLERRRVFEYLSACEPVEADVTLLSVCDRLATRGQVSQSDIDAHIDLAERMLTDALHWRAQGGSPKPLLRGDELAQELKIDLGPRVGELLRELSAAQYAGEISTREQALELIRGGSLTARGG